MTSAIPFEHDTRSLGEIGEEIAADYLQKLGYTILERNYHYGTIGEIDIIAQDGEDLVFCEVKARRNSAFGEPEYAITPRKQAQVRKLAGIYLYEHNIDLQICRFDVVAIKLLHGVPHITYLKNAF